MNARKLSREPVICHGPEANLFCYDVDRGMGCTQFPFTRHTG